MSAMTIEERLEQLEHVVFQRKHQIQPGQEGPWWERTTGKFAETPAFDEAMDLGRHYRDAERPIDFEDEDVPA